MNVSFQASDLFGILPVLIVCLFGMAAMLFEVFAARGQSRSFIGTVCVVGLIAALAANHRQWGQFEQALLDSQAVSVSLFGGMIVADTFVTFFNMIFFGGALLTILLSQRYLVEHEMDHGEYYALVLFAAAGMSLMAAARDLIVLFVALEVMSVGVYVLTGFMRNNRRSAEAALKYFLMGAFASGILLYGVALLYGATGTTNLAGMRAAFESGQATDSLIVKLGLVLLLGGMGFKVALAPFHLWTPDVYEGAPSPITAFMAVGVKAAGFAAIIRIVTTGFGIELFQFGAEGNSIWSDGQGWVGVLYLLAILTMFAGNLGALNQTNVKRMLAYSSIAHAGYLLVGVVASAFGGVSAEANSAVVYYLMVYTFSTFLVFGVIVLFGRKGEEFTHLSDFAGVGFRKPFLGLMMSIGILSLAGMPPLGGFFAKFYLFREAMLVGRPDMIILVVIAIVNSMIALYYYIRVMVFLYMKEATREVPIFGSAGATAVMVISVALVLVMGVFPDDYLQLARRTLFSF